jgi:hypothetical protein
MSVFFKKHNQNEAKAWKFSAKPKGLNLQRREEHGYTFASVNRLTPHRFPARNLTWKKL